MKYPVKCFNCDEVVTLLIGKHAADQAMKQFTQVGSFSVEWTCVCKLQHRSRIEWSGSRIDSVTTERLR